MTFRVDAEQLPHGTHVVSLAGEIDLYNAPDVEEALLESLGRGATHVVVDLCAVTFIDSVALGVLVRTSHELRDLGGRLAIACPPDVARFFEVAGLDRILPISRTRAEAVARVSAP